MLFFFLFFCGDFFLLVQIVFLYLFLQKLTEGWGSFFIKTVWNKCVNTQNLFQSTSLKCWLLRYWITFCQRLSRVLLVSIGRFVDYFDIVRRNGFGEPNVVAREEKLKSVVPHFHGRDFKHHGRAFVALAHLLCSSSQTARTSRLLKKRIDFLLIT